MTRAYLSAARLADLERSLSQREQAIIGTLDRLRVATTLQLRRLHFTDLSTHSAAREATRLLARLADRRLLTKLDRQVGGVRAGSKATIWTLDVAGQRVATASGPAGGGTPRRPWTPSLTFLAHRLAISEAYVSVVERCRAAQADLLDFDVEPFCWRRTRRPSAGARP